MIKRVFKYIYNHQSTLLNGFLFLITSSSVLYLFPIKSQWAFEFDQGQPWEYEQLYAPFDFGIIKSSREIEAEKREIQKTALSYFDVDQTVQETVQSAFENQFQSYFDDPPNSKNYQRKYRYGLELLNTIYYQGVLPVNFIYRGGEEVALIIGRSERDLRYDSLIQLDQLNNFLASQIDIEMRPFTKQYYNLFFEILQPNLSYNEAFTEKTLSLLYDNISPTRDLVPKGELIIAPNELVEGVKWEKLRSLQMQYSAENLSKKNYNWIVSGYLVIIGLTLLMLMLFLHKYRPLIFNNSNKMTFVVFNILMMVTLSTSVIKFNSSFLYAVPICIFPLISKTFFDARLGLFVHVLTVLLIGFVAPNGFEYVVIQILAGIVTVLSVSELYKRANLFISVIQITFVYLLGYFAFFIIREGGVDTLDLKILGLFVINGLLTLFVQPLIYLYEKIFNLVSDVSLLELSDTNSVLFKELSNKAPGTFHHSLQVANLAEAAAVAINANVLLTRVGALYHDIGKIHQPPYFTENQRGRVSPHDDLSPLESARIIIKHVIDGIELARKYNLPDRVIDFIRTHHGTSTVYYFYKKHQENDPDVDPDKFRYGGPKPFSKETAIVMMSDAVEAASKSLKEPTVDRLESFVTKIIDQQMDEKQFVNSNITLAEIETVKKILINKLVNIYHLRVEYPE